MNSITEDRVRKLAYQIWEAEGRPHGQDLRHWEMAQVLAISPTVKTPVRIRQTGEQKQNPGRTTRQRSSKK